MSSSAIFLSYASQDADAARRICDALRAAGLEVWFDQSELRGGDAWDQSIRKQIKECALFVPLISASTDSRPEGYFRLEWKLAVDRSHLMADDQPFFVPIILGDLSEPTARVPDKFRERQWTRLAAGLSGDAALKAFAERVAKLSTPGDPKPAQQDSTGGALPLRAPQKAEANVHQAGRPRRRLLAYIAAGLIAAGAVTALALWQPWKPSATQGKAGSAPALDPVLMRAIGILDSTNNVVADVALAEDLVKGVLSQRPTDADATVAMARIHAYMLLRGWDTSEERYANAKRFSERALSLAPTNPDAMVAMATYLYRRRVELPRAVKLARDAIALAPDNPNHHRMLVNALSAMPDAKDDEVLAAAKQVADRFPNDALAQYEMGRLSRDFGRVEDAEKYYDLAIKRGPVSSAYAAHARLRLWVHNDLPGMKALLDAFPERMRTTDRAIVVHVLYGMAARDYTFASTALAGFPEPWMSDFEYTGPTALLIGEVLLLQGKTELAKIRFTEAQMELSRRKPVATRTFNSVWLESWLLMRLGKLEEARARNAIVHAELPRPYRTSVASSWIFSAIPRNLLLGERQKALELMRECAVIPLTRTFIRNAMVIDPRMEPFRNDQEIVAILAEPASKP